VKGGYQPQSRLAGLIDEVKMEAIVARASQSRQERDRAFAEIERLAGQCADLLTKAFGQRREASYAAD
jgi:hypothetical protein